MQVDVNVSLPVRVDACVGAVRAMCWMHPFVHHSPIRTHHALPLNSNRSLGDCAYIVIPLDFSSNGVALTNRNEDSELHESDGSRRNRAGVRIAEDDKYKDLDRDSGRERTEREQRGRDREERGGGAQDVGANRDSEGGFRQRGGHGR